MFLKNLWRWLCGNETPSVSSCSLQSGPSTGEIYERRYEEMSEMPDSDLHCLIASRESERLQCGVAYHIRAERAAARVRSGGKTYAQRYSETSALSTDTLHALKAERVAQVKETGVIDRVLAGRGGGGCGASSPSPRRRYREDYGDLRDVPGFGCN